MIMVMPVGAYYKGGLKPVRAVILDDWDRAAPHGMGDVKVGGNYAASLFAHEKAKSEGWPVELYLDAKEHKYVEEFSTSNFLGIKADGTYVTPDSHSVLPSVTNMSLKQCAADLGWKVECRKVPYEEIKRGDPRVRRSRRVRHGRGGHARLGDHARQRGDQDLRSRRRRPASPEAVRHGAGHPVRTPPRRARLVPRSARLTPPSAA